MVVKHKEIMLNVTNMNAEESRDILGKYVAYISGRAFYLEICDAKHLPSTKEKILMSLLRYLLTERSVENIKYLIAITVMLADFQEGVGDNPLTPWGVPVAELGARKNQLTQPFRDAIFASKSIEEAIANVHKQISQSCDRRDLEEMMNWAKNMNSKEARNYWERRAAAEREKLVIYELIEDIAALRESLST